MNRAIKNKVKISAVAIRKDLDRVVVGEFRMKAILCPSGVLREQIGLCVDLGIP